MSNSISDGLKNNFEEDNIEKVIVGLEPSNAVSSSYYVDRCQFKKESETETRKLKRSRK